jgi:uncharacterized protein YijF (DUF1287 family)
MRMRSLKRPNLFAPLRLCVRMIFHAKAQRPKEDGSACARLFAWALLIAVVGCGAGSDASQGTRQEARSAAESEAQRPSSGSPFLDRLVVAAIERTRHEVRYDPTYFVIAYPGGDVPAEVGVCTDEVIRAYRAVGVDLQKEVHEDMARNFQLYPKKWGLSKPDTNIDHRRVPNLRVFFSRKGQQLPVTADAKDYRPGDIVTWDLGNGLTHIGIVVNVASEADKNRFQIVHNIGAGPRMEDVLFNWKITGHYRYTGPTPQR